MPYNQVTQQAQPIRMSPEFSLAVHQSEPHIALSQQALQITGLFSAQPNISQAMPRQVKKLHMLADLTTT